MATARDLCTGALRKLGVLGAVDTMSSADAAHLFGSLNDMIDEWANDGLLIYSVTRTTATITSGDGTFTVGSGGDIAITRPQPKNIDHVTRIDTTQSPELETPLSPLTDDAWELKGLKTLTSPLPTQWWYNPTFPLGTLELWPVPTQSGLEVGLYTRDPISEFSSLDTTVSLPPGYRNLLINNLALEVAPDFQARVTRELREQAEQSIDRVKRQNTRMMDLSFDAGALVQGSRFGRYNIYSDS